MSADEIIPIVDENDTVICYKMRKDVKLSDIYRDLCKIKL